MMLTIVDVVYGGARVVVVAVVVVVVVVVVAHAATWLPKMPSRGRSNGPSGGCRKDGEPPSG